MTTMATLKLTYDKNCYCQCEFPVKFEKDTYVNHHAKFRILKLLLPSIHK